jgi:hypothetical protein
LKMRGIFLKTSLVAGLVAGLLFAGGAFSPSDAGPVPAEFTAAFKVIDNFGTGGGDGTVKLTFSTNIFDLQYGYGAGWNSLGLAEVFPGLGWYTGTLDVNFTGSEFSKVVYFKTGTDTTGAIMFSTPDFPLWHNVALNFDPKGNSEIAFAAVVPSNGNNDHVAPVPIPAGFWLFGSGLLGLIGIRRKITH